MRQLLTFGLVSWSFVAGAEVAFIGDSISTGGASHPKLKLERQSFTDVLRGQRQLGPDEEYYETLAAEGFTFAKGGRPPLRLFPTSREFSHPLVWFVDNLWTSFGTQYFDAEEYSWSYLLGRQMGYTGEQILIAAKNGERMEHSIKQMDRILAHTNGRLPEHLFVLFTGNDLCARSMQYVTSSEAYRQQLTRMLRYVHRNATDDGLQRHIWLVEPLGVLQIVTSGSILRQMVPYQDKEISCREMQTLERRPMAFDWSGERDMADMVYSFAVNAPISYCPTLFGVHGDQGSDVNVQMANRILGYREGIRMITENLGPMLAKKNIFLHNIRETSQVIFEGEDIANDCFHLNLNGQIKIAKAVKAAMDTK